MRIQDICSRVYGDKTSTLGVFVNPNQVISVA